MLHTEITVGSKDSRDKYVQTVTAICHAVRLVAYGRAILGILTRSLQFEYLFDLNLTLFQLVFPVKLQSLIAKPGMGQNL